MKKKPAGKDVWKAPVMSRLGNVRDITLRYGIESAVTEDVPEIKRVLTVE